MTRALTGLALAAALALAPARAPAQPAPAAARAAAVAPAAAQADAPAGQAAGGAPVLPRSMRPYWHVFTAYALVWTFLLAYAVSLGRRFARLQEEVRRLGGPPRG